MQKIAHAEADALWLKVSNMGANSTANAVGNYIAGAADFQVLGIPLVADHFGGIPGLSLLAFGAVGGLAHGITMKEQFNANAWLKIREGKGFQPQTRIYLERLGLCMKKTTVLKLFENNRAKSRFGCLDNRCCPRTYRDTIENPVRHAVVRRSEEVREISSIPIGIRPSEFLNKFVRRMAADAVFASQLNYDDSDLVEKLQKIRKAHHEYEIGLIDLTKNFNPENASRLPKSHNER